MILMTTKPKHPKEHKSLHRISPDSFRLVMLELLSYLVGAAVGYTTTNSWAGACAGFVAAAGGGGVHRLNTRLLNRATKPPQD